jgi:D-ribose pyranase
LYKTGSRGAYLYDGDRFQHNAETFRFLENLFSEIPVRKIPHETFKERLIQAKAVIRTGEATPHANVILESGVAF